MEWSGRLWSKKNIHSLICHFTSSSLFVLQLQTCKTRQPTLYCRLDKPKTVEVFLMHTHDDIHSDALTSVLMSLLTVLCMTCIEKDCVQLHVLLTCFSQVYMA